MSKTFTADELLDLLEKEPDTKLKKKLLEELKPKKTELEEFRDNIQHIYDLLADTLGKKRITVPMVKRYDDRYARYTEYGRSINYKGYKIGVDGSLEHQDQMDLEIIHDRCIGEVAKISLSAVGLERAVIIAKTIIDYITGQGTR